MSDPVTLRQRWVLEHGPEEDLDDPFAIIFCGTEACEREAAVLIENRVGLAPLCQACLSAFEFGAYGIEHPEYREIRRELL